MNNNQNNSKQLLLDLICQLAYREGDFTLSSGQSSSYYVNCKLVTLHPYGAFWTGETLFKMLPETANFVAGLTLGADPIVTAVSVVSAIENHPVSGLIVRKKAKGHGTGVWIEGPLPPAGAEVVVLEDVVTTGQSALFAVEKLRQAGYTVQQIISLVDRQSGGAELYAKEGLKFERVFSIAQIQAHYAALQVQKG
ncbi:orotate phosphoribosyltransferase [Thalassoporum mexicanum PCC 7367]|uniref:orotate phosphoribosyltransferase n=1 Tax=Thalassoporum mexicanum TaxID=3457544 RepID=UPI00029FEAB3|nr:orotate phosphoribosyltransferase [Pseudanabaena sp. PCC 7367]AFY70831.1 orotate phosphoribosyltransferase [Pseudanabaena sp. PCC 7367]